MFFWARKRGSAKARSSVKEDWFAQLPDEKNQVFDSIIHEWESAYAVFSVSLDDAMSLRAKGKLARARQCVDIAASVVSGLTEPLASSCRTIEKWGRQLDAPPSVAAPDPSYYRSDSARQNAQWNQLVHHVRFGSRSRFLHKLRTLETSVSTLGNEFHREAGELAAGVHVHPDSTWPKLDELHDDVNTCLRETIVMLKSFMLALPPKSLAFFYRELNDASSSARETVQPPIPRVPR